MLRLDLPLVSRSSTRIRSVSLAAFRCILGLTAQVLCWVPLHCPRPQILILFGCPLVWLLPARLNPLSSVAQPTSLVLTTLRLALRYRPEYLTSAVSALTS